MDLCMAESTQRPLWQPRYTLTPAAVRSLLEIEAAKTIVDHTPFPPAVAEELRRRARVRSTHYSTRIEGNRLTLAEAERVVSERRGSFPGRERDVAEVRNYLERPSSSGGVGGVESHPVARR
jgi:Fic family protein